MAVGAGDDGREERRQQQETEDGGRGPSLLDRGDHPGPGDGQVRRLARGDRWVIGTITAIVTPMPTTMAMKGAGSATSHGVRTRDRAIAAARASSHSTLLSVHRHRARLSRAT